jgi:hypothetical protein
LGSIARANQVRFCRSLVFDFRMPCPKLYMRMRNRSVAMDAFRESAIQMANNRSTRKQCAERKKRYTGRRHRLQSICGICEKELSCRIADLGGNTAPCMGLSSMIRKRLADRHFVTSDRLACLLISLYPASTKNDRATICKRCAVAAKAS